MVLEANFINLKDVKEKGVTCLHEPNTSLATIRNAIPLFGIHNPGTLRPMQQDGND